MQHSKIIRRDDGSFVRIEVRVFVDLFVDEPKYAALVSYKGPGKRKWIYDSAGTKATQQEIHDTKLELWHLLKPQK